MLALLALVANRVLSLFFLFIFGFVIERFRPVEPEIHEKGLILNGLVGFCFIFADELALMALSFALLYSWDGLFSSATDGGSIEKSWALLLAWLVARDFFYYWFHRLQHGWKWLWPQHALHHSEEHVNITTSVRHHWLEMPLTAIFVYVPLNFIFPPPTITFPIVAFVLGLMFLINHMNFRFGLGPFNWLFATPQIHRIHHSRLEQHIDKNFAAMFPIWDVIFGTYYRPAAAEYPPTGLSSGERVTGAKQALLLPFSMWRKMLSSK